MIIIGWVKYMYIFYVLILTTLWFLIEIVCIIFLLFVFEHVFPTYKLKK